MASRTPSRIPTNPDINSNPQGTEGAVGGQSGGGGSFNVEEARKRQQGSQNQVDPQQHPISTPTQAAASESDARAIEEARRRAEEEARRLKEAADEARRRSDEANRRTAQEQGRRRRNRSNKQSTPVSSYSAAEAQAAEDQMVDDILSGHQRLTGENTAAGTSQQSESETSSEQRSNDNQLEGRQAVDVSWVDGVPVDTRTGVSGPTVADVVNDSYEVSPVQRERGSRVEQGSSEPQDVSDIWFDVSDFIPPTNRGQQDQDEGQQTLPQEPPRNTARPGRVADDISQNRETEPEPHATGGGQGSSGGSGQNRPPNGNGNQGNGNNQGGQQAPNPDIWIDFDNDLGEALGSSFEERMRNRQNRRAQARRDIDRGWFNLESQTTDESTGRRTYDRETQELLVRANELWDLNDNYEDLFGAVQLYLGMTVDHNGTIWGSGSANNVTLSDADFRRGLRQMVSNQENYGYPFLFTDTDHQIGGTTCFVIPIPTPKIWHAMTSGEDSALYGRPFSWAVEQGLHEWNQNVHPAIIAEDNVSQRAVLENMMYAVVEDLPNVDCDNLGITSDEDMSIEESFEENERVFMQGEHSAAVRAAHRESAKARREAYRRAKVSRRYRGSRARRNADGSFASARDMLSNTNESIFRMTCNAIRFGRVMIDPRLAIGAFAEKGVGTFTSWGYAKISLAPGEARELTPTGDMYAASGDPAIRKDMEGYAFIKNTMGAEALKAFTAEKRRPTMDNISRWLKRTSEDESSPFQKKAIDAVSKFENVIGGITSADYAFKNADWKRFMDAFMVQQLENKRAGQVYLTAEQVSKMVARDPSAAFVQIMGLDNMSGLRAYHQMEQRTLGGSTYLSEPVSMFLRRHPIMDTALGVFLEKWFIPFSIKAAEKWIPMLNTGQYLMLRANAKKIAEEKNENGDYDMYGDLTMDEMIRIEMNSVKNGELITVRNMRDCITMDLIGIGSNIGKAMAVAALMSFQGFEPPDKEEDLKKWDEWKVGGDPFRIAWACDDLLTWAGPLAVAGCVMYKTNDLGLARDVLLDGLGDTVGTLAPVELVTMILNPMESLKDAQRLIASEDPNVTFDDPSNPGEWMKQAIDFTPYYLAGRALSIIPTWSFLDQLNRSAWNEDDLEHSAAYRYTPDPDDDAENKELITDPGDVHLRQITRRSLVRGAVMDFITGFGTPDPKVQKTGYQFSEMPTPTLVDPFQKSSEVKYTIDVDDSMKPIDDEAAMEIVEEVLSMIDEKSGEELRANSVVIPFGTRVLAEQYLWATVNERENWLYERHATPGLFSDNGKSFDENRAAKEEEWQKYYHSYKDEVKEKLNRLWNDDIPFVATKYNLTRTDYQDVYTNADGSEATALDYVFSHIPFIGDESVDKRLVPYGNARNPLNIFSTHATNRGTFSDETPVAWWDDELTDIEFLKEQYGDMIIPEGTRFAGQNAWDLLSHNGVIFDTENPSWSLTGTLGVRGYIPVDAEYMERPKIDSNDPDLWTGKLGDAGKKGSGATSDNSNTAYDPKLFRYRTSGKGGAGSAYNPKIYSNPRSINADRAASMYTKQPYGATRSYLRPGFETKGSREAYKRSDI